VGGRERVGQGGNGLAEGGGGWVSMVEADPMPVIQIWREGQRGKAGQEAVLHFSEEKGGVNESNP
jgi:hypothetical protein